MKKIIVFLILALLISACGQNLDNGVNGAAETDSKKPPELVVSSSSNEVEAVLGTYSWSYDNGDGTFTSIDADSDIPPRIVNHQSTALHADLRSEINMDFTTSPEEIRVNIWSNSQLEREVNVEDSKFKTDEEGYIIYEIHATWEQGTARYAVKINVE